ncbi:permease for cytosine/purines, uracil, thiamine, allantoin-domain-containing protein [Dipodascopsis uninucleata]
MFTLRERLVRNVKTKATSRSAWVIPKEESSFAPPGEWTNKDSDVTPPERRTWTSFTILGFWFSDTLSMQRWEAPASIIVNGLTYKEAIICSLFGMLVIAVPMVFNGAIGSNLHIPYPIAARSSFGYHFAKFVVVVRLITALFWHAIQTFSGALAVGLCIASIWPSYNNIPNHIPESIGLTTQQMVSHLIYWLIQLPVLCVPPHKLRYFFLFKAVVVSACAIGMAAGLCHLASGSGDIWNQQPKVHGSARRWLILSYMMSSAGGWATMATNIPDFTRYMRSPKGQYWQVVFIPVITIFLCMMSILATSAGKVLYGSYIWDPTQLASKWTGSKGRTAAFFVGLSWAIGQIGTNLSANVIPAANDWTSLFPKYLNIRRGAIITTIIGGWVMQPWKIENSANQLLTFMSGLSTFLAPIAGIIACDYWLVKRRKIDVPALYRPRGIYRYAHGINWRSIVTFLVGLVPNLPGLAHAITPSLKLSANIIHLYQINYFYGFGSAIIVYFVLNLIFPHKPTLLEETVSGDIIYSHAESLQGYEEGKTESVSEEAIIDEKQF